MEWIVFAAAELTPLLPQRPIASGMYKLSRSKAHFFAPIPIWNGSHSTKPPNLIAPTFHQIWV
jgi:hypothetical protein